MSQLQSPPIPTRKLGRTEFVVSEVGFGTAPLGELFEKVSEADAQATLEAAWASGIRYYDTSPFYGYGLSEHRVGHFLRQRTDEEFALSTKVGRVFKASRHPDSFDSGLWAGGLPFDFAFDYSYDGIMRSWEDSLQRLGLPAVDVLLIHDLDHWFHITDERVSACLSQLYTSGWRALEELRSGGCIKGIGAGINQAPMIPRFLDLVDLDFFIVAVPYTLLDQGVLDDEFPRCVEREVGVVIGAPFASGILATGPVEGAYYAYSPATPEILEKTRLIQAVCEQHDTPLAAAAMHFPLAHPSVAAIIPGALKPEQVSANVETYRRTIPADLWAELKREGLIREDAPTP